MRRNDGGDDADDTVVVEDVLDNKEHVPNDDEADAGVTPEVLVEHLGRG